MAEGFPEILSRLRQERQLSQRTAAAALHISQALLSHYENGAREPGLSFVCKACDYYGVSADFMLCRTEIQNPAASAAKEASAFLDDMQELLDRARSTMAEFSNGEEQT